LSGSIGLVYNEPTASLYNTLGEGEAVAGVLESVAAVGEALESLGYDVVEVP